VPVLTGWRAVALDGMAHAGVPVGCTMPFTAPVNVGHPCHLTLDVSCQFSSAWGTGALHGTVGEPERRGSATSVAGPLSQA
jgi:hypothetical protein